MCFRMKYHRSPQAQLKPKPCSRNHVKDFLKKGGKNCKYPLPKRKAARNSDGLSIVRERTEKISGPRNGNEKSFPYSFYTCAQQPLQAFFAKFSKKVIEPFSFLSAKQKNRLAPTQAVLLLHNPFIRCTDRSVHQTLHALIINLHPTANSRLFSKKSQTFYYFF